MTLVLEDPGGAPLDRLLGGPLDVSQFLRIAIPLAGALRRVHERGLIHKDIKPANILADPASGGLWLTGFGIASRLPREHQAPAPLEVIAGTLAYMAPEQTGRMNRSVDSRSDLYSLGVTFYEMLTGQLPFTAAVIIDGAFAQDPFSADEYIRQKHARSVLFLPLVKQAKLIGVLYLENKLASHVFTPARISVLELLASQAAISLENARLYSDLQEREAKIRRLVDSNIIGIIMWDLQGRIIDANEAFLDMVGYAAKISFRVAPMVGDDTRRMELHSTNGPWQSSGRPEAPKLSRRSTFAKTAAACPFFSAERPSNERRDQGVAFVLDLTERKRAEEKLRESERRYREAQIALAHVNRVTTMGQLTASIAHEASTSRSWPALDKFYRGCRTDRCQVRRISCAPPASPGP
jgi:serine/threonine protein kinase